MTTSTKVKSSSNAKREQAQELALQTIARRAGGSAVHAFNMTLITNTLATAYWHERAHLRGTRDNVPTVETADAIRAALSAFVPSNEIEAMLASSAVGLHAAALECLRRAAHPDGSSSSDLLEHAVALSREMRAVVDTLDRRQAAKSEPEGKHQVADGAAQTETPSPVAPSMSPVSEIHVDLDDTAPSFGRYGKGPIPDTFEMIPGESLEDSGDRLTLWALARSGQPFYEDPATGRAYLPGVTVPGRGKVQPNGTLGSLPTEN